MAHKRLGNPPVGTRRALHSDLADAARAQQKADAEMAAAQKQEVADAESAKTAKEQADQKAAQAEQTLQKADAESAQAEPSNCFSA